MFSALCSAASSQLELHVTKLEPHLQMPDNILLAAPAVVPSIPQKAANARVRLFCSVLNLCEKKLL